MVVRKLLEHHEAMPRTEMLRRFKTPLSDSLQKLTRCSVLTPANQTAGSDSYLPRAVAFHYCGDAEPLAFARRSTEIVLQVLRNLFDVQLETDRKEPFSFDDAMTEARRVCPTVGEGMVSLGLYLAQEFSVFWTRQMDAEQIGVDFFLLNEYVYSVTETGIEAIWNKHIAEGIAAAERDSNTLNWAKVPEYETESADHDHIIEADGSFMPLQRQPSRKVFLVHGRSEAVLRQVSEFLQSLDLEVVILYKEPNRGQTVIEKFERHSDVGFAVVLLTPDDVGAPVNEPQKENNRARQNVILELGYFIAKLGRERVCPIQVGEVELPSDIHGIVWVPYDDSGDWCVRLAEEINLAGIKVDMGRVVRRPRVRAENSEVAASISSGTPAIWRPSAALQSQTVGSELRNELILKDSKLFELISVELLSPSGAKLADIRIDSEQLSTGFRVHISHAEILKLTNRGHKSGSIRYNVRRGDNPYTGTIPFEAELACVANTYWTRLVG
jgi:hypothetical protein